jgi:hypothetical protein
LLGSSHENHWHLTTTVGKPIAVMLRLCIQFSTLTGES